MFHDVGKELKRLAKTYVILRTIPCVLLGIVVIILFTLNGDEHAPAGFAVAAVIVAVGYGLARLAAIQLYAYGELVDRVTSIEQHIVGGKNETFTPPTEKVVVGGSKIDDTKSSADKDVVEGVTMRDSSYDQVNRAEKWECKQCHHLNPKYVTSCENCRSSRY